MVARNRFLGQPQPPTKSKTNKIMPNSLLITTAPLTEATCSLQPKSRVLLQGKFSFRSPRKERIAAPQVKVQPARDMSQKPQEATDRASYKVWG